MMKKYSDPDIERITVKCHRVTLIARCCRCNALAKLHVPGYICLRCKDEVYTNTEVSHAKTNG